MTMANTTNQGLPYPLADEKIADVNDHIRKLALAVEKLGVQVFADMTSLGTKLPSPTNGMLAYVSADHMLYLRDNGAWQRVWPAQPRIYTGSTTPASSLGAIGDVYVQS